MENRSAIKRRIGCSTITFCHLELDNALRKIASHGITAIDAAHGTLTVHALNAVAILPAILEALAADGLQPGQVHLRQNTLEDVFIRLTGRRLRE